MITMLLLLLLSLSMLQPTFTFPGGAGNCASGRMGALVPSFITPNTDPTTLVHQELMQVGTGPLSDFMIELQLDGVTMSPDTPTDFTYQEDHTLSLIAMNDNTFTGFLIRLASVDFTLTIDSLSPITNDANNTFANGAREATETCRNVDFVGGVTHSNASQKKRVDVNLFMEEESMGLEMEVTVVIRTNVPQNISHWYYSKYILNSIIPMDEMTTMPSTSFPSAQPVTAPSAAPTLIMPVEPQAPTSGGSRDGINYYNAVVVVVVGSTILFQLMGTMWM